MPKKQKSWQLEVSNAMKLAYNNKIEDSSYWLSLNDSYPLLNKKASVILAQFATTYLPLRSRIFLIWRPIKTKSRDRLNACSDIPLAQFKTKPNIKGLLRRVQEHVSH